MWVSYFAVNYAMPSHVRWRHGMKNIFRVTDPLLCSTQIGNNAKLRRLLCCMPEQTIEQTGVSLWLRDTTTSNAYFNGENIDKSSVFHYDDVIMTTLASQITSLTVVYSIVYSGVDQRKHQSSASLAFVRGIHRDRWIPRTKGQ